MRQIPYESGKGCVLRIVRVLQADGIFRVLFISEDTRMKSGESDLILTGFRAGRIACTSFPVPDGPLAFRTLQKIPEAYQNGKCTAVAAFGGENAIAAARSAAASMHCPLYVIPVSVSPEALAEDGYLPDRKDILVRRHLPAAAYAVYDPALLLAEPEKDRAAAAIAAAGRGIFAYLACRPRQKEEKRVLAGAVGELLTLIRPALAGAGNAEAAGQLLLCAHRIGEASAGDPLRRLYAGSPRILPFALYAASTLPELLRTDRRQKKLCALADLCLGTSEDPAGSLCRFLEELSEDFGLIRR